VLLACLPWKMHERSRVLPLFSSYPYACSSFDWNDKIQNRTVVVSESTSSVLRLLSLTALHCELAGADPPSKMISKHLRALAAGYPHFLCCCSTACRPTARGCLLGSEQSRNPLQ
jgi:hypothetical protein